MSSFLSLIIGWSVDEQHFLLNKQHKQYSMIRAKIREKGKRKKKQEKLIRNRLMRFYKYVVSTFWCGSYSTSR